MNSLKTFFLMTGLTLILILIGSLLGGRGGATIAFFFALGMNFFTYFYSDRIVLSMYRAHPISPEENPSLYKILEKISHKANLSRPKLYLIPTETPNAFATGRDPQHACVAVTSGLLRYLDEEELEGVLSHELSHIKNRDILIATIAATLAGAISLLAFWARWAAIFGGLGGREDREGEGGGIIALLAMAILAPIAALIIQMAISRTREYLADERGAKISGNPRGLANALKKLEGAGKRIPMEANPATSHLFIVNPLRGESLLLTLFSTHPPVETRIERLMRMAHT